MKEGPCKAYKYRRSEHILMTALSLVCMLMLLSPQVHGLIAVTGGSLVIEVAGTYRGQRGVAQLEGATGPIQVVWGSEDIPTFVTILFGLIIITAIAHYIYKKSPEYQKSGYPVNSTTPNPYFTLEINTKTSSPPSNATKKRARWDSHPALNGDISRLFPLFLWTGRDLPILWGESVLELITA